MTDIGVGVDSKATARAHALLTTETLENQEHGLSATDALREFLAHCARGNVKLIKGTKDTGSDVIMTRREPSLALHDGRTTFLIPVRPSEYEQVTQRISAFWDATETPEGEEVGLRSQMHSISKTK